MLKKCAQFLGLVKQKDKETRWKKEYGGALVSVDLSHLTLRSKDIFVRIVHAGGREELYQNAVSVSLLLEKYPGMCVARPEVFKNPSEAFLCPDENVLPGQKYYLIPSTTARKLKLKVKRIAQRKVDTSDARITWEVNEDKSDESIRSAKEFFISKEKWSGIPGIVRRRGVRGRKPFVPPLPKVRQCPGLEWEPSLTSIQELSP
ncbi:hypothetical protein LWI28_009095 [Acer negundo]|uniref:Uncharacterized protein n=1 Tax=Acer negundo TaxID=4023 RepID=A0AAD5IL55_ACENE|nr:hypothetical protein LWI28_009095 [Acer negundo]KAK4842208.1 hypothetical protein QYF36_017671 [Acer negundo]